MIDLLEIRDFLDAPSLARLRSETTHEVTPVTQGERFTVAAWFR